MGFLDSFPLAIALSMDAFAVSLCKGLSLKKAGLKEGAICGLWFGGFQALMPLIGYFLASLFAKQIEAFDHWVAFGLLLLLGLNMLKEAFEKDCEEHNADLSAKTMFLMALATSIDAMASGIPLAVQKDTNIYLAVALIGTVTFLMCIIGVKIGSVFGTRLEKKAQAAGGIILILLGVKILLEHLGILG